MTIDQLYMAVYFWSIVKRDMSSTCTLLCFCTVAYTSVTFTGFQNITVYVYVYLVGMYLWLEDDRKDPHNTRQQEILSLPLPTEKRQVKYKKFRGFF